MNSPSCSASACTAPRTVNSAASRQRTLVKLATRILYPTAGTIRVRGRVSALIEVFVGSSNVYYNQYARFCDVFNDASASTHSIGYHIDNLSTGPEAQWVVAMLNATIMTSSFPYSTAEVLALYQNTSGRSSALTFFQSYLGGA